MKSSEWAKNIFSVTYYLMLFGWVIILGILIYAVAINSSGILEAMADAEEFKIKTDNALYTFLGYGLISGGIWIYMLYLFKNLIQDLISGPLFTKLQIASFKLIGQLIIFMTIIDTLVLIVLEAIFNGRLEIEFDLFDFWLEIAVGAFLIFLSEIFNKAIILKQENELTV